MSDLTVLTVAENEQDAGLIKFMIDSVYKFTNPKPYIIICDNGRNGNVLDKYRSDPNISIISGLTKAIGGSNRHGESLNQIFHFVKTKKAVILDSDCIVLSENWCKLDFNKHKAWASKKGETSSGHPFYHVCYLVFSAALLKHGNMDFRPGDKGNKVNYLSHEDVGWRLREKLPVGQTKLLQFVDLKNGSGKCFCNKFQSDEFWMNGEPMVAHFGRGSNIDGKAIRKGFPHPREQLREWKKIAEEVLR